MQFAALIPFFPLAGFIIVGLLDKRLPKKAAGVLACSTILISFIISVGVFINISGRSQEIALAPWIDAGHFSASFSSFLIRFQLFF